jgi:23S rRNA (uracil1939-C5)-methyltransferase
MPGSDSPTATVTITDLAYGGEGVGHLDDGRAVFVPFSACGDQLRVRLTHDRSHYAKAEIDTILEPGTGRTEPVCPYYGHCGGCCYQHLTVAAEEEAKLKQLGDLLRRIGGLEAVPAVAPVVRSASPFGYRNKLCLQPVDTGERPLSYGFAACRGSEPVPIKHCPLGDPRLNDLLDRVGRTKWGRENSRRQRPRPLTVRVDGAGRTVFFFGRAPSGLQWLEESLPDGRAWRLPVGSFAQVNREVAGHLLRWVLEQVERQPLETFVDVYCGAGMFALAAAATGARVFGMDNDEAAILAARHNAEQLGCGDALFVAGDAQELLSGPLDAAAAAQTRVLLDPPREGCQPGVLRILQRFRPTEVIYVSCNPATLARDLKRLSASYRLESLAYFDMFPRTSHFEAVARLSAQPVNKAESACQGD